MRKGTTTTPVWGDVLVYVGGGGRVGVGKASAECKVWAGLQLTECLGNGKARRVAVEERAQK
jgi:hypothetical protein